MFSTFKSEKRSDMNKVCHSEPSHSHYTPVAQRYIYLSLMQNSSRQGVSRMHPRYIITLFLEWTGLKGRRNLLDVLNIDG